MFYFVSKLCLNVNVWVTFLFNHKKQIFQHDWRYDTERVFFCLGAVQCYGSDIWTCPNQHEGHDLLITLYFVINKLCTETLDISWRIVFLHISTKWLKIKVLCNAHIMIWLAGLVWFLLYSPSLTLYMSLLFHYTPLLDKKMMLKCIGSLFWSMPNICSEMLY